MLRYLLIMGAIYTTQVEALLPPAWQDVAEVKAILNAPDLSNYLESGDAVESIAKTDAGWEITTNHSKVKVEIVRKPQNMPGPEKFTLKFYKSPI
jgi:hypothetical protein